MAVNRDFSDLFAGLNAEGAEFLVIGGYALAAHGAPRFTKDLDLWIRATPENAQRVWRALDGFGAPLGNLELQDLHTPGVVFQIGIAPNRIDVLTSADGVEFEAAWARRMEGQYDGHPVPILGKEDLIANKRAAGRTQDLADIEALQRAQNG